jgi:glutamate-1-semialdehyde aminotransferase
MSHEWWRRQQNCIAQGALTNSKHPDALVFGAYPIMLKYGHGCYAYAPHPEFPEDQTKDIRYIDYICGLGCNLMGYGNDRINQQLLKVLYGGFSHSLPTTQEVKTAEKLKEIFVFVDKWKFLKSGSEACAASLKFARAATGRTKVISEGYHGIADEFVSLTPPHLGVPDNGNIEKYTSLENITNEVAAVILEPVIVDDSKERIEWLKLLRARCDEVGALLIFDEVITGFRYRNYGVSNSYGILPDLIVIGKAMANGLPLAAVGGKAHIMDNPQVFVSSTYAGERGSLKACEEVCTMLQSKPDYNIENLWNAGIHFMKKFNDLNGPVRLKGYPTRGVLEGSEVNIAIFMAEMADKLILFHKSWFYNWGLIEHEKQTIETARNIFEKIKNGLKLEYPMPKSPFSMEVRK